MPQPEGGLEYLGEGRFEESDRIPLQEYASWVLPGASLVISVPYSKSLPPGEYQAELVIEFGEQLPVKGTIKFRIAAQKSEPSQKKKYLPVCGFSPAGVGGRFRRILTNDRMIEKKAVKEGRRDENLSSAPPNSVRHPLIGPRQWPVWRRPRHPLVSNVSENTFLVDALRDISTQTGVAIVADSTVTGQVTLTLDNVTFEEALIRMLSSGGYVFSNVTAIIWWGPDLKNPSFVLLSNTDVVKLRYVKAARRSQGPGRIFTALCQGRRGQRPIVITAPEAILNRIKADLALIDRQTPQVMIRRWWLTYQERPQGSGSRLALETISHPPRVSRHGPSICRSRPWTWPTRRRGESTSFSALTGPVENGDARSRPIPGS